MVLNVIVIISPAKGKEARVEELIRQQIEGIQENEPGVLYDRCYQRKNEHDDVEFVIIQKYKDEHAYDAHFRTAHRKGLPETIKEEQLLTRPMVYMKLEPTSLGFER